MKNIVISILISMVVGHAEAQNRPTSPSAVLAPVNYLLLNDLVGISKAVNAVINPSRTECASPCTVVFSAEKTSAHGLDSHGVWSQLSYYWDFDTDESDTYGSLYKQTYTYVEGDTSFEKGHVPMATKTFLCEVGICVYKVGMRAQNVAGEFDDAFVDIAVKSESEQWSAADTVCISNTLDTADDWTGFDKPCPAGAIKQNVTLDYDQYNGKLVLFKNGDMFTHSNHFPNRLPAVVSTLPNQSNFKLSVFGDSHEERPNINGKISLGMTRFDANTPRNEPFSVSLANLTDTLVDQYGWPSNIYIEGLKVGSINLPMSYQHVGMHDLDMDREAYTGGGNITVTSSSARCHDPDVGLSCDKVPYPKGGYISSVNIVGGGENGPGLNIGDVWCSMVNFLGITDTQVRRSYEHNLRIAGWYRTNIMRSFFRGLHLQPVSNPTAGKNSKITLRSCNRSGGSWEAGRWFTDPHRPSGWDLDVMNTDGSMRTRADSDSTETDPNSDAYKNYIHMSRYQVVAHNRIGEEITDAPRPEGVPYLTNVVRNFPVDFQTQQDLLLSHNIFERQTLPASGNDFSIIMIALWGTCVGNVYQDSPGCTPVAVPAGMPNFRREPLPTPVPLPPGS
ncbi:MAG: hypothetical protein ACRBHB_07590 [Arenicella sp.]